MSAREVLAAGLDAVERVVQRCRWFAVESGNHSHALAGHPGGRGARFTFDAGPDPDAAPEREALREGVDRLGKPVIIKIGHFEFKGVVRDRQRGHGLSPLSVDAPRAATRVELRVEVGTDGPPLECSLSAGGGPS